MQQENKQQITKQDLQEMAQIIRNDFNDLKEFTKQGFEIFDERFNRVENQLDRIEAQHDRRLTIVEDRVRVVKNVLEKDLRVKVAW